MIDSSFTCACVGVTEVGGAPAIIPEISGRAWITAMSNYVMDETDPFAEGFSLTL